MTTNNHNNDFRITDDRCNQLVDSLCVLRAMAGVSQEQVSATIGISRQTYVAIEGKKKPLSKKNYLLLLMYFDYHEKTHSFLRQYGLFPEELILEINSKEESA